VLSSTQQLTSRFWSRSAGWAGGQTTMYLAAAHARFSVSGAPHITRASGGCWEEGRPPWIHDAS